MLVLERHTKFGGTATTFRRPGFTAEVGLHQMDGLDPGNFKTHLFRRLGVDREVTFLALPQFWSTAPITTSRFSIRWTFSPPLRQPCPTAESTWCVSMPTTPACSAENASVTAQRSYRMDLHHPAGRQVRSGNPSQRQKTRKRRRDLLAAIEPEKGKYYELKYNRRLSNIQGSLLLISHLPDGTNYRLKNNALYGLSPGTLAEGGETWGWASFSGKANCQEPGWEFPEGNHEFIVYVEDRNEPGAGTDRFWIQVRGKDGAAVFNLSLPLPAAENTIETEGGNIVAPH